MTVADASARVTRSLAGLTVVVLAALSRPGLVRADDAQAASNQALAAPIFGEATAAMEKRDFAAACPKLEEVVRLVPDGIGAKLALGECYVGLGKLATAQRAFVAAEASAAAAKNPKRQAEAHEKAAALDGKLALLTLVVSPEVLALPDLRLVRNGAPVSVAELGVPIAVDAGTESVTASAPGRVARTFEAKDIVDGARVTITVDALAEDTTPATTSVVPGPTSTTKQDAPELHPFWGPQRIAGLVLGVVGAGGAAVGLGLAIRTDAVLTESEELGCDDSGACPTEEGVSTREDALTLSHGATAAFIAGGALFVTGVLVFATAPSGPVVTVGLGPHDHGGLMLRGRF